MNVVKNSDLLSVQLETLLADYDRETISNLYQPIVGFEAIAIFFTLWGEASNQKIISITTHEDLFLRMQMNVSSFVDARKKLEAVGLLSTKRETNKDVSIYHYMIYAPKTPYEFFSDTLLYGLLVKNIGEVNANRLKNIYKTHQDENEGEDITSSFGEVFHPDYDDAVYTKVINETASALGRRKKKMNLEFSYETFFKELALISQINEKAFTKNDMKELTRLASLYGIDENTAAAVIVSIYDESKEKGQRIDFDQVNKSFQEETNYKFLTKKKNNEVSLNSGDTDLAHKINILEKTSPKDYLSLLANGTKPCIADLKIIDSLSKNYHLNNGVINVIIDYVLATNDNVLSKAFAEKIASSLARSNITRAIDAMNYLNNHQNRNKKETSYKKEEIKKENVNSSKEKVNYDKEWDEIMSALSKTNNGKD